MKSDSPQPACRLAIQILPGQPLDTTPSIQLTPAGPPLIGSRQPGQARKTYRSEC